MNHRHAAVALLAGLAAGATQAQEDNGHPYYVGARLGYTHEDNVFRVSGGAPKDGDNITSVTLLGGINQPIGRQRIYADASVSRNNYADLTDLNNTSYGLSAGLDWSTIERFAGNFNVNTTQSLARFNPGDAPNLSTRNIQTSKSASATVRMGIVTRLSLTGGLSYRQVDFSAPQFDYRELNQTGVSGGVQYRFSGLLTAGAALRHTEANYPRFRQISPGVFQTDKVKRNDLDLTATWTPTGASTVNGRVSFGRNEHTEATNHDFSGVTTLVNWRWLPTGRLALTTQLSRDSGNDVVIFNAEDGGFIGETDNSRVTTALQTQANYQLTGKISLNARLRYAERELTNTFAQSGGSTSDVSGSDRTTAIGFGANWAVLRTVTVGCNASHEKRNTSSTLSSSYSVNTIGCFGQIVLQP